MLAERLPASPAKFSNPGTAQLGRLRPGSGQGYSIT